MNNCIINTVNSLTLTTTIVSKVLYQTVEFNTRTLIVIYIIPPENFHQFHLEHIEVCIVVEQLLYQKETQQH